MLWNFLFSWLVVVGVELYLAFGQGHFHRFDFHHLEVGLDLLRGRALVVELLLKVLYLLLYISVGLQTSI